MKKALLFLIPVLLSSCKKMLVNNSISKNSTYSLVRYRRAKVNMVPIVVGQVSAMQEKAMPLFGTFFLDGQRLDLHEADRADKYVLNVSPGTHRLQLVTITYRTAEAHFRVKTGDSLRIDFQLQLEKRPLY
jgi:hypothetical protein